jgi:hypothetical protein
MSWDILIPKEHYDWEQPRTFLTHASPGRLKALLKVPLHPPHISEFGLPKPRRYSSTSLPLCAGNESSVTKMPCLKKYANLKNIFRIISRFRWFQSSWFKINSALKPQKNEKFCLEGKERHQRIYSFWT